jgi:cytochrome c-type biogenesis protein CcmH
MGKPGLAGTSVPLAAAATPPPAAGAEAEGAGEIAALVAGLEKKVAANADDPEGWRMLGWSYFQMQRFDDSARAYGKAVALKPDGTGFQSAYGEALVQVANGAVTPAAAEAFAKAQAQDGADARARYFLGVKKQQDGDAKGALDDWITLLGESATDAPWVPQLRSVIEQTAGDAKIDVSARLAALRPPASGGASVAAPPMPGLPGAGASAPAGVMPGPSADQVAGAAAMTAGDRQAMIRGMVDGLAKKLQANPRDESGWLRLMRARSVLGENTAAARARNDAIAAFAGDPAAQARIRAAATEIGIGS